MKKKILTAIALTLTAMTLTACGATSKPSFAPNWQSNALSKEFKQTTETLVYDVTFEKSNFLQKEYFSVEYCGAGNSVPGTYTTTLECLDDGTYKYSTDLSVNVTYTLASDATQTVTFTDSVQSEVVFHQVGKYMQPVYSKKKAHCYSPRKAAATELKYTYTEYNYEFLIEYNEGMTEGKLTRTDLSENPRTLLSVQKYPDGVATNNFEIDQKKLLCLDNEQLLFALRGLSNKEIASEKSFNVYNASMLTMEKVTTSPLDEAKTSFTFSLNGAEPAAHQISYTPLSLKINGRNATLSQELWYAQTTSSTINEYRNVLLKMKTPMHSSIGSLIYTLRSATFGESL